MKRNEMRGVCSCREGGKKYRTFDIKLLRKISFEYLIVERRVILKLILRKRDMKLQTEII
jgi:hypothetical protein